MTEKKQWKYLLAGLISVLLVCGMCACGHPDEIEGVGPEGAAENANSEQAEDGLVTGSLDAPASYRISQDEQVLFDEAMADYAVADVMPIAYLGSQIVAGTNHCFLCRFTDSIPDAKETYAFIRIYEDLNGKAVLRDVRDSHIETHMADAEGSWSLPETPDLDDAAKNRYAEALGATGSDEYLPLCLLSQLENGAGGNTEGGAQASAEGAEGNTGSGGKNECIFARTKAAGESQKTKYVIAYLFEDSQGQLKVTEITDFNIDE